MELAVRQSGHLQVEKTMITFIGISKGYEFISKFVFGRRIIANTLKSCLFFSIFNPFLVNFVPKQ
jgi:hypothetical protein